MHPSIFSVMEGSEQASVIQADAVEFMAAMPDDSVDLVFGSPPYDSKARRYRTGSNLKGEEWVAWMVEIFMQSLRVCNGLVAYVIDGSTNDFRWSCTPAMLMADLHRRGVRLRKPACYVRNGIPGSGGKDWWKNNWEFIVCASSCKKKLPWSDNLACGHEPIYKRSGPFSNRKPNGTRNHRSYTAPKLANPGNVINCKVGGNQMGSALAHDNEAPFPEMLPDRFVRSFCRPGGVVLDPFSGSGTTGAVSVRCGRRFVGCDIREDQVSLSRRRIAEALNMPVSSSGLVSKSDVMAEVEEVSRGPVLHFTADSTALTDFSADEIPLTDFRDVGELVAAGCDGGY